MKWLFKKQASYGNVTACSTKFATVEMFDSEIRT